MEGLRHGGTATGLSSACTTLQHWQGVKAAETKNYIQAEQRKVELGVEPRLQELGFNQNLVY
jgi:hypothetical protein